MSEREATMRLLLAPVAFLMYALFVLPRAVVQARRARRRLRAAPRFIDLHV